MTSTAPRKTSVNFGVVSELTVADETVNLILEKIEDRGVTVFRGGMIAGQRLLVVALLEELIPELDAPESMQNLAITKLAVELRPQQGAFAFEGVIENAWSITLDSGPTIGIESLAISVLSVNPQQGNKGNSAALSQQRKLAFAGVFELFGGEFTVQIVHQFASATSSQWRFSAVAENISITEVMQGFGFSQERLDEYGLRNLVVSLGFTLQQTRYQENNQRFVDSSYSFRGELLWDTGIALVAGEETLQIEAAIEITKTSGRQQSVLQGLIGGTVKASIPFFDTLQLSVIYTFSQTSTNSGNRSSTALARRTGELIFQLQISTLLLSAVYTNVGGRKLLRFSVSAVSGENPTVGDLIAYIVSLYDPSITEFELDPPWDELASQKIALDRFSLEIDLTKKTVTISYRATVNVLIAKVDNLGLSYQFGTTQSVRAQRNQARTGSNKKVAIAVNLSIPGQPQRRVQWDPVNENPPTVPSTKAPIFELKFLAVGQRVAFAPEIVQQARTIEQVTKVMRQSLVPLPPIKRRQNPLTALQQSLPSAVSSDPSQPIQFSGQPIRFSAESGWLIGAQFTILGALELSVIFNDPFIYGVRISLSGPLVQSFAGLELEILYRRISDNVGVYRTELTLPDAMRQLEFGAVSITLPVVAIEIYTNGDFGVDVGFPWGGDFSRSIAVSVLIFLGLGGFYFNKLSAETATSVPQITNGNFNPVLEFGIGLKVGLGKIIQKGPLRAELSITMHGILQGVFATFNPTDSSQGKVSYYRVQGGVAIVGRIYGVVDFKVIQVDLEVVVKVAVLFVVEVYKAIQVALVATVSVRASIKIAFIRIRFKFSLTVREQFVLGSDSKTPWRLAPTSAGAMAVGLKVFRSSHQSSVISYQSSVISEAGSRGVENTEIVGNLAAEIAVKGNSRLLSEVGGKGKELTKTSSEQLFDKRSSEGELRWDDGQVGIKLALPQQVRGETVKDGKLRLDIYFQPSFTKTEGKVKGIGLLFMENSLPLEESTAENSNLDEDNDTDFDELVKALFKWVIYAYLSDDQRSGLGVEVNVDGQVLSLEFLEAVYNSLVSYLDRESGEAFWLPLIRFLSTNFIFDITDRPLGKTEISGTIFPMFPQLEMELKDSAGIVQKKIDFDGNKYTAAQIRAIQNYFQSFNHNHDQGTEEVLGTLSQNDAGEDLAIAQLLFVDYFSLIIRSVLQLGIDHLRDKKAGVNRDGTITVVELLDNLNGGESFGSLAGMTSRFLLHGLRLPTFAENTTDVNGQESVYLATGQQFEVRVTAAEEGETVTITPTEIRLSKPTNLHWIRLIDDPTETSNSETLTPELNYPFSDGNRDNIQQLAEVVTNGILPTSFPRIIDFYNSTPQRYTIRQKISWHDAVDAANNNLLWELPLGLSDYLKSNAATVSLRLFYNQQVQEGETLNPNDEQDISAGYQWGTKLSLDIRRVSQADGEGFLATVYAIEGLDTASQGLLSDLLIQNGTPEQLFLLSVDSSTDSPLLSCNPNAQLLILKTNLAVESNNSPIGIVQNYQDTGANDSPIGTVQTYQGTGANDSPIGTVQNYQGVTTFLQLLRESSIASSGGYYLNYSYQENDQEKGLPESLFADGDTGKVTLLMTFSGDVASYHNCLHIPHSHPQISEMDSGEAIFAESSETVEVLNIPAGNLGWRLTRGVIEAQEDDTAIDEIQNLYQLLSYQVDGETKERLPMGPIEEDDQWVYEKVLPVYALTGAAKIPSTALPEVLKHTLNPYYGIGSTIKLDFRWQDIYGNLLGADGEFPVGISQKLGYFDPILGINQWPSVGESYTITRHDDNRANLSLELVLDQAKYIPTTTNPWLEALDKIKSDRATYQQVYYQVHDDQLQFTVSTSVIPTWSEILATNDERAVFTDFVDNVYRYLVTLESLVQFEYTLSGNQSLQGVANEYGLNLEDLGEINRAVTGMFSSGQKIQIPVGVRVLNSNSLPEIANLLIENSANGISKVEEIVHTYADTADLLAVGTAIGYTDANRNLVNYTVQSGDTFTSLAIAQLALAEDAVITGEITTIAEEIGNTQTVEENGLTYQALLMNGVLLKTAAGRQMKIAVNSTLEEIADALLRHEQTEVDSNLAINDETVTAKIEALLQENLTKIDLLQVYIVIDELNKYVVRDGESLSSIQTTQALTLSELTSAIRNVRGLLRHGAILTGKNSVNETVTIHVVSDNNVVAISNALNSSHTVENLLLANRDQANLLIHDGMTLAEIASVYRENPTMAMTEGELTSYIATIINLNLHTPNLLAVGTEIAQLNYTVQNQDTFATIITRQTELDTSQDLEKVVAILRNIQGLFSNTPAGLILPSKTVAIATLPLFSNHHSSYQVQSGDSIQCIAMEVVDKSNLPNTLKANSVVELDTLEYDVIPQQAPRSLTQLADNLNRETNRHRTVLETVQNIGNINDIITEAALSAQLSVVAAAVSNITGLFGDEDIILANVLFNYTVIDEDSFETIIAKTGDSNSQILIDQTTAANIATQNPNLELQSGKNIYIPDRFSLDVNGNHQLAIAPSSSPTTSLTEMANSMGGGITAAAVAIANQSLAGLLNSQGEGINLTQVLAKLIALSNGDRDNLTAFVTNSTLPIRREETFYTLKSRWETEILTDFHHRITLEASLVLQNIGTVNAIYEQLTFPDANLTSLYTSLTEALNQLKTTLLVDVNGNNLKPHLQPSTVHHTTVEIAPALNKIQTAIETLVNSPTTASLLNIQTLLQEALYAHKNEPSSYSNQPLDGLHSIYEFSCLKIAQELLTKREQNPLTVAEIATAMANLPNLITPNQNWIIPPPTASQTFPIPIRDENNHLNYPQELLFPVTVKVTMERNQTLMHPDSLPEAQSVCAYFSPKTIAITSHDDENADFNNRLASLNTFATKLETALPNFKLAVGRNNNQNANPQNSDNLWAVHLGATGINYNINETFPFFFSAAPLTNTPMSGTVQLYNYNYIKDATTGNGLDTNPAEPTLQRVDAVDLNGLARTYLRAIEDLLTPEIAVPAAHDALLKTAIARMLAVKVRLADAISQNVTPILETSLDTNSTAYQQRQAIAIIALRQELLKNLADAYDIETIVQYNVDVTVADNYTWSTNNTQTPCLSGQPIITSAEYLHQNNTEAENHALLQSLDFALSPGKIALDADKNQEKSTLTFFFNTQTPQRYEDIALNLTYQVNELEYNIDPQNSTSSWLNFVLPLNNLDSNNIGKVQIPIPLRDYPLPPSLIAHQAIPDPDSFAGDILSTEDIRDWNYVFLYEHPDVAQDTIECHIDYNSTSQTQLLRVDDVTVSENSGNAIFTVTLFPPSDTVVTVDYTTKDGTAIAGQDYTTTTGSLRFAIGETSKTITVPILSDTILEDNEAFTLLLTNATNAAIDDPEGIATIIDAPLLDTLVRFNHLYPTLTQELQPLATGITEDNHPAFHFAFDALATLAEEVANAWQNWQPIAIAQASRDTIDYNIDEDLSVDEQTKIVTIAPTKNLSVSNQQILAINLPGYQLNTTKQDGEITNSPTLPYTNLEFNFTQLANTTGIETFGESSLPDRQITVANLDVLEYQSAWGAIRLARNKNLIDGRETNRAFIFQTPEVRFKNRITPLIINDKPWDIAALGNSRNKTLAQHLQTLFSVLLPTEIKRPYDLRITCQYAFALVSNPQSVASENQQLLASLPVLMIPRFTVQKHNNITEMLPATQQLRDNMEREITLWQEQKQPNTANGRYIFSISFFSHAANTSIEDNPNLPLLTVENLYLLLVDLT